jgi:hypothetical protein
MHEPLIPGAENASGDIANIRATGIDEGACTHAIYGNPAIVGVKTPLDRKLCVPDFRRVCQNQSQDLDITSLRGQQVISRSEWPIRGNAPA